MRANMSGVPGERRKRVLVVEDDPDLADTVAELLESRYEVTIAADGQQALEKLATDGFDAIVLDLMLPEVSGEGVLEEMRRRNWNVPVLIATARDDGGEVMQRAGAADWLQKPFAVADLYEKLARIVCIGGAVTSESG